MRKVPKINKTNQGGMGFYAKNEAPVKPSKSPAPKKGKKS